MACTQQHTTNEYWEGILESISDGFWVLDCDWRCTYINKRQAELIGLGKDEILGKNVWDLFPDIANTEVHTQLNQAITEQTPVHFEHFHPICQRWVENRVYPFPNGITIFSIDITERKQADEAVQTRQDFMQQLANMSPGLMYLYDVIEQRNVFVNARSLDLLGYSPETILAMEGDFMSRTMHPDDLARIPGYVEQLKSSPQGSFCELEYRMQHINGEWRWFSSRDTVFCRTASGQIHQILGTAQDITDRICAVTALRESEARFRGVVESNMVGILFWEASGCFTDGNNAAAQLLGYSREELQSKQVRWQDITPSEYQALDNAMVSQIFETGSCPPFEKEYIRKDGSPIPVLLGCALLPGYTKRGVAFMLDITERKRAEFSQRLLADASSVLVSSLDYQNTLANIARLVVPIFADFCIVDVVTASGKVQRIAWQHCDATKQAWFDRVQSYVPSQDLPTHPIAGVLESGKAKLVSEVTQEWMQAAASSADHLQFLRDCQIHSLIIVPFIARGRTLGAMTLCTTPESDRRYKNSDLVLAEELAYRAALAIDNAHLYQQAQEANRMKDEFLTVLSHELRSPLNPILGWTQLLQTRKFDEQATARALETIERNARLQARLVEDLLDVSRILRGKMLLNVALVNLTTIIEAALEAVHLSAQAKNIQIQTLLQSNVEEVLGDASRLQQVVWNLLSNAIKFTPIGGQIEIRLEQIERFAQIQVKDTGRGIRSEFLPHVFEYFRQEDSTITRNFGGLGLGLAIVRHLIELHGGTIRAESLGEGLGATFTIRLPLATSTPPHKF
ncbi:PAS domain S-box protein [Scytonema sp. UIC 10036]|uniref:PAS domain S-box protein n=1 Tax=Scytonema sp. UIC 10036 TaxID=2304196 RepID=UPI0012DA5D86|nr:PAS domain S-box protein [Scytonema sp. UIC 10036]MUG98551.1 PAS domain S-box protein [Scytonema sp. UIC 10036]